jgi:hypothetical protein
MPKEPKAPGRSMGNYLCKARRNFYLTQRCWELMHEISMELGVNHSNVIEFAIRRMYSEICGKPAPPISEGGFHGPHFR